MLVFNTNARKTNTQSVLIERSKPTAEKLQDRPHDALLPRNVRLSFTSAVMLGERSLDL